MLTWFKTDEVDVQANPMASPLARMLKGNISAT